MARVRKLLCVPKTCEACRGCCVHSRVKLYGLYGFKGSIGINCKHNRLPNTWLLKESMPGKDIKYSYAWEEITFT